MTDYKKYGKEVLSGLLLGVILTATAAVTFCCMTTKKQQRDPAQEIKEKILSARHHAANHGTYIAVVFPHEKDTVPTDLKNKSLRICEVAREQPGTRNFSFRKWVCDWHKLPQDCSVPETFCSVDPCTEKKSGKKQINCTVTHINGEKYCNCLVFNPRGTLYEHKPVRIIMNYGKNRQTIVVRITGMCKIYK